MNAGKLVANAQPTMKQKEPRKIVYLATDSLKPAGFNPKSRTERSAIRVLVQSLALWGEIFAPIIVSRDGYIIDGHRRHAAAVALGWPFVPCIVVEYGLQELWADINQTTRIIRTSDLTEAALNGLRRDLLPQNMRKATAWLDELYGSDDWGRMIGSRSATSTKEWTARICRYLGDDTRGTQRAVIRWLIRYNCTRAARAAMDARLSPVTLHDAISRCVPIFQYNGVWMIDESDPAA